MTLENHRFHYVGDTFSHGSSSFFGGIHSLKNGARFRPTRSSLGRSLNGPKKAGFELACVLGLDWRIIPGLDVLVGPLPFMAELYGFRFWVLGCSFLLRQAGREFLENHQNINKPFWVEEVGIEVIAGGSRKMRCTKKRKVSQNPPVIFGVEIFHPPIFFRKKNTTGCC